jgi:hypothetical protein
MHFKSRVFTGSLLVSLLTAACVAAPVDDATVDRDATLEVVDSAPVWNEQVKPQPDLPLCPHCLVEVPYPKPTPDPEPEPKPKLIMTIEPAFQGAIETLTLVVTDKRGTRTTFFYGSDSEVMRSVNHEDITEVLFDAEYVETATLIFVLDDQSTHRESIPVREV